MEARPWYGWSQICVVWDDGVASPDPASESERIAAIDFGVDNLAAMANNIGMPGLLFKGGIVKSENQWFNKEKARITSELTKGKEKKPSPRTHRLDSLSRHREGVMRTQMNTCARRLVERCVEWDVDTIVLGVNRGWKQNADMGTASNQKFVSVPHDRLRMPIRQLAEARGIRVVDQEESYTSKASFLHGDEIPVYGETDRGCATFSGWRETRGMYKLKGEKKRVNADLNGAGNTLRKAFPQRISPKDDRFLQEIIVV